MVTLTWASPVPQNPPASKISAATCVGTNQLEPIPGLLTNLLFFISSSSMESFSCGGRPATDVAIVFSYAFEYIRNIMFGSSHKTRALVKSLLPKMRRRHSMKQNGEDAYSSDWTRRN